MMMVILFGPVFGQIQLSQVQLVMVNNNPQSMLSWLMLNSGIKVTVLMLMTWVVSTKTEKLLLLKQEKKIEEFMLLTTTIPTNLV